MRRRVVVFTAALALAPATASAQPQISVLSSRADLVSAGNAVVRVTGAKRVRLNGRDVTKRFRRRHVALLTGLKLGRNVITAGRARLVVTNHPNGGPLFTGPQIQPWKCQEDAVDAQCNQPAEYELLYRSSDPDFTELKPYDPENPPSDVATTTTDQGVEVPFVVRSETGYQDRDRYKILTLFDPAKPWTRFNPQPQFNHKVFIPHGGNCGSAHKAGNPPLEDYSGTFPPNPAVANSYLTALGRGFAVMSTALNNLGHNCNVALAAESMMMAKERIVERYGDIRYTIGSGCSGGSITQQTVANAYPRAVYDGLIITWAYPDAFSTLAQFADYHLLRIYFEKPENVLNITPAQWGLIEGRPDPVNAIVGDEEFFKPIPDPSGDCGVPAEERYDAGARPDGVRCGVLDFVINLLGARPRPAWSENERKVGRGFAGIPFGNMGVQYGLGILEQGLITPEQFVDLNAEVGGLDIDFQHTAERLPGDDRAIARAYRTGLINESNNLSGVAIIHHGGPDPGAAHDYAHSLWIRDRLTRAQHGNHDNHVLWYGPTALIGDITWANEALGEMDRWLANIEQDKSKLSRAKKVVAGRPGDLVDRCPADLCTSELGTAYGTPRTVAGGPKYNDVNKCSLKPLQRADYSVTFTDAQWTRMLQTFPTGVCDFNVAGVGQQPTKPYLSYGTARRHYFGGRPLGPAPRSRLLARARRAP